MAVNVRHAEQEDFDVVMGHIAAVYAESPRYSKKKYNPEKAASLVQYFVSDPASGGFVCEVDGVVVGIIGGAVAEYFASDNKYVADILIYVEPKFRGTSAFVRLIKAFEEWARAQGVPDVILGISLDIEPEQAVCVYEKLGYRMYSYSLIKTLEI